MMEKVDDDHVFSGEFSVVPVDAGQALPAELRVEVLVEGRTIAVQVDRDGRMHLPIRQDWVDAGASLRINQPKDKLALRYDFHARPPSGTRMRYSELAESAAVMARGIKAEAGWLAFAAPMPHGLDIRFPPGQAQVLEIRFADGSSQRWRSEARRVGKEGVSTCRSRWSPDH